MGGCGLGGIAMSTTVNASVSGAAASAAERLGKKVQRAAG
jgi:hypothetical protein